MPTVLNPAQRRDRAKLIRIKTAELAHDRKHPKHSANGDEQKYRNKMASFTKGLPHDIKSGVLYNPEHFDEFVKSINTAKTEDQRNVCLGPWDTTIGHNGFISNIAKSRKAEVRGWESSGAGHIYDLQGIDAQAVTMPPVPKLASGELLAEMTECYCMALLRDASFLDFDKSDTPTGKLVAKAVSWINDAAKNSKLPGPYDPKTVFRGAFAGERVGPMISQFLLVGTEGIDKYNPKDIAEGLVQYGAMTMDQRVKVATPGKDYMTTWASFIDVQNGADLKGAETYEDHARFTCKPRDLATYVHHDALYQSYFNACLILLGLLKPDGLHFDDGIPFQEHDSEDKQSGFASWGGPHILTLLTEVSTRALHAVRYQKFNIHRRARAEAIGGLIDRYLNKKDDPAVAEVKSLAEGINSDLLEHVANYNAEQNNKHPDRKDDDMNGHSNSYLLPMAYPEGSPMHASYGSGHAAVGGACVTILKAWFDHNYKLEFAYEPTADGKELKSVPNYEKKLTVEHELNKLAANIGIGRNWAGVHYYSDWYESAKLGESVALSILEEQAHTYPDNFSMTIPTFEDGDVVISKKGDCVSVTKSGSTTQKSFFEPCNGSH